MPRAGPRKVRRYSLEFKLKAVKLSQLRGVEVQAVADALAIHPFVLSKWRKEAREGVLRGARVGSGHGDEGAARAGDQALQRSHALLVEEHALLTTLIRFASARKPRSLRSSSRNERPSE